MEERRKTAFFVVAACILLFAGFRPQLVFAEGGSNGTAGRIAEEATGEVRVSSFPTKAEAEHFVKEIVTGGYETVIRTEHTEDNKTVYSVFVIMHGEQPARSPDNALPAAGEGARLQREGMPVGTEKSLSGIFGSRSFFHASLALTELFTDNAYISNTNKRSGSSTVLSPEIWILLPRTEQHLPRIENISTRAPGGLILSRSTPQVSRRYKAFLLYHADIPLYSSLPSERTVSHRAAGGYMYNGNRVLAGIMDQFERSYDVKGTGVPTDPVQVDKYKSNLLDANISYDTGNRFRLMLDYSNFWLSYDDAVNDFQDRVDNSVAGYVFYQVQPKTALFVEYDFINISHDKDASLDNREHNFFAGIQWDITAKSRGTIKAGYGVKDFSNVDLSYNNYIFQARITHHISSKNIVTLTAYRQTDESDYIQSSFIAADGVKAVYLHRLTSRMTGAAALEYTREKYEDGDFTSGGVTMQRKDNIYNASLSLRYQFKKWLQSDIGYEFTRRDSNFSDFSYTSNTMFFRITGAI